MTLTNFLIALFAIYLFILAALIYDEKVLIDNLRMKEQNERIR